MTDKQKFYIIKDWDDYFDQWVYNTGDSSWSYKIDDSVKYTLDGLQYQIQNDKFSNRWKII